MTFNKGPWLESNQGCRSRVARAVTVRLPGCSNNLLQQDKTPSACQPGLTICFANCSLLTIDLNMFSFSPPPSFTSSPVLFAAPPSPPLSLLTNLPLTHRQTSHSSAGSTAAHRSTWSDKWANLLSCLLLLLLLNLQTPAGGSEL